MDGFLTDSIKALKAEFYKTKQQTKCTSYLASSFRNASQVAGLLIVVTFVEDKVAQTINAFIRQRQTAQTSPNLKLLLPLNLHPYIKFTLKCQLLHAKLTSSK